MPQKELTDFIVDFIAGRRQQKLDAFDKEAARQATSGNNQDILRARRELELRYETRVWLTDAARQAAQISEVTHAAKFTHGDAKSSSIYSEALAFEGYLSTAMLAKPDVDAVGNAAVLGIAKLLQTRVGEDSLLDCLRRHDARALEPLAESPQQLAEWVTGFSQALQMGLPVSHKLAKQVYFPVAGGYHLLNPLFSSSLAQALHQRVIALRFSEETKAAWQARRNNDAHPFPLVMLPNVAVMNFGGTKPQNISALNSARGGKVWLLPSRPPVWAQKENKPLTMTSLFGRRSFDADTRKLVRDLVVFLRREKSRNNDLIRRQRARYVERMIDVLLNHATNIQRKDWAGWTQESACRLRPHQQLWLDPWRTQQDAAFSADRSKGDWQYSVADDFALWLNSKLKAEGIAAEHVERVEWRGQLLRTLQEMEQGMRGIWP